MEHNLELLTELYKYSKGLFKKDKYLEIAMVKNNFFSNEEEALELLNELIKDGHLYIDRTRLFGDTYSFRKPTWTKVIERIDLSDVVFDETPTKLKKVAPVKKDGAFKRHKDILMFIDKLGQVVFEKQIYEFMDKIKMDSNILQELIEADLLKRSESIARTGEYIYILKKGAVTRIRNKNGSKDTSSVNITNHREMLSYYRMAYTLPKIKKESNKQLAMSIVDKMETTYHSNLFTNKNNVSAYVEHLMEFYMSNQLPLGYTDTQNIFALEIADEKNIENERAKGLKSRAKILQLKLEIKELECNIEEIIKESNCASVIENEDKRSILNEMKQSLHSKKKEYDLLLNNNMQPKQRKEKKYRTQADIIDNRRISALVSRNTFITNLKIDTSEGKKRTKTDVRIVQFLIADKESVSNMVRDIVLTYKIAKGITVSLFSGFNSSRGASSGTLHYYVFSTYSDIDKLIKEIKATDLDGTSLWNCIKLITV